MNQFIELSASINLLTDCKKLRKNLHTRYLSAAKTHGWHRTNWNGQINAEKIHVKPNEFYEWIKKKHPKFIPKLPPEHLEHPKELKKCFEYNIQLYSIGVYDEPQPPETIEQSKLIIDELMAEVRRLDTSLVEAQQTSQQTSQQTIDDLKKTIDALKPDADRYRNICLKNKINASKKPDNHPK